MGYLQNGICYGSQKEAKADFISHVNGVDLRKDAMQQLDTMTTAEIKVFFPECRTAAQNYAVYQSALLSVVIFLLICGYVKKTMLL